MLYLQNEEGECNDFLVWHSEPGCGYFIKSLSSYTKFITNEINLLNRDKSRKMNSLSAVAISFLVIAFFILLSFITWSLGR